MFEGMNDEISSLFGSLHGDTYTRGYQNQFYGSRDQHKINFSSHPSDYAASSMYRPNYCLSDQFDVARSYDIASSISPGNPSSRIYTGWARAHGPQHRSDYNDDMDGYRKFVWPWY